MSIYHEMRELMCQVKSFQSQYNDKGIIKKEKIKGAEIQFKYTNGPIENTQSIDKTLDYYLPITGGIHLDIKLFDKDTQLSVSFDVDQLLAQMLKDTDYQQNIQVFKLGDNDEFTGKLKQDLTIDCHMIEIGFRQMKMRPAQSHYTPIQTQNQLGNKLKNKKAETDGYKEVTFHKSDGKPRKIFYRSKDQAIAAGSYGEFYVCWDEKDDVYGIKVINKKKVEKNNEEKEFMKAEFEAMMRMKGYANWVELDQIQDSKTNIYVLMKICNGGDLWDLIETRGGSIKEEEARLIMKQLVSGLCSLKANKIIHRDIKGDNVLIHSNAFEKAFPNLKLDQAKGKINDLTAKQTEFFSKKKGFDLKKSLQENETTVKLCDLGRAKVFHPKTSADNQFDNKQTGTINFMATRCFQQQKYSYEVDVQSLGFLFYYMLCGFPPLDDDQKYISKFAEMHKEGDIYFPKSVKVSFECLDLLTTMMLSNHMPGQHFDSTQQLQIEELVNHPWLIGKTDPSIFTQPSFTKNELTEFLQINNNMEVSSRQWLKDRPNLSYELNLHNKDKFNKLAAENGYTCRNHRLIKTALVKPQIIEEFEVIDSIFDVEYKQSRSSFQAKDMDDLTQSFQQNSILTSKVEMGTQKEKIPFAIAEESKREDQFDFINQEESKDQGKEIQVHSRKSVKPIKFKVGTPFNPTDFNEEKRDSFDKRPFEEQRKSQSIRPMSKDLSTADSCREQNINKYLEFLYNTSLEKASIKWSYWGLQQDQSPQPEKQYVGIIIYDLPDKNKFIWEKNGDIYNIYKGYAIIGECPDQGNPAQEVRNLCARVFDVNKLNTADNGSITSNILVQKYNARLGAFVVRNNTFELLTSSANIHGCKGFDFQSKSMQEVETAALAGAFMINVDQGWKVDRRDSIELKEAIKQGMKKFQPYNFGTILSGIYCPRFKDQLTENDSDFLGLMKGKMDEIKPNFQTFLKENGQTNTTCFSDFVQKFDTKLNIQDFDIVCTEKKLYLLHLDFYKQHESNLSDIQTIIIANNDQNIAVILFKQKQNVQSSVDRNTDVDQSKPLLLQLKNRTALVKYICKFSETKVIKSNSIKTRGGQGGDYQFSQLDATRKANKTCSICKSHFNISPDPISREAYRINVSCENEKCQGFKDFQQVHVGCCQKWLDDQLRLKEIRPACGECFNDISERELMNICFGNKKLTDIVSYRCNVSIESNSPAPLSRSSSHLQAFSSEGDFDGGKMTQSQLIKTNNQSSMLQELNWCPSKEQLSIKSAILLGAYQLKYIRQFKNDKSTYKNLESLTFEFMEFMRSPPYGTYANEPNQQYTVKSGRIEMLDFFIEVKSSGLEQLGKIELTGKESNNQPYKDIVKGEGSNQFNKHETVKLLPTETIVSAKVTTCANIESTEILTAAVKFLIYQRN